MARPRPQNFRFVNGIPGNFGEVKPRLRPASAPVARRPSAKAQGALSQKPRWIAYDRKVSAGAHFPPSPPPARVGADGGSGVRLPPRPPA